MTKTKKVMAAAVSVVLAGTMAVGFTACGKKNKSVNSYGDGIVNMGLADGTTLNVAIGYNSQDTGLFYGPNTGDSKTFVGGYQAFAYGKKPAAEAIEEATGLNLVDKYPGESTSNNLTTLVTNNSWGNTVDLATADLTVATQSANDRDDILNLAKYLDYMPNFKAFLEENPIVYLSVLGEGMQSDGSGQELYVAPYFDGMDDIEKSILMRQDWVAAVLDTDNWTDKNEGKTGDDATYATNDVFQDVCYAPLVTTGSDASTYTGTHAESYMGKTGSWSIVSTAEPTSGDEADGSKTITITKNYEAAKNALTETDKQNDLYTAYCAIAGSNATYSTDSGNIVDIMNEAISADSTANSSSEGYNATGENLANLYKAYIATAYTVSDSEGEATQYYGTTENPYSNVFCGYSACWDVDDLTALLRIIKCSSQQVGLEAGQKTTGIFPRDYTNSRTPDLISLVGELYGARGATSRYEQVYFDSNGAVQDARNDEKFWDSLVAFGGLAREGLVDCGYLQNGVWNKTPDTYTDDMHGSTTNEGEGFMQWDYSQTQTTQEFDLTDIEYGWVNNPVSIWDDGTTSDAGYSYSTSTGETITSGAGATGKYMRFTDSWRSTKTAGLVVAKSVEKDENKLAAALTFVDFLYSNDGQITTTYAIQSTNGNTNPNGTWYGTDVTSSVISRVTEASSYTDLCDETYQYVIKSEYKDSYVVYDGKITNKDGSAPVDEEGNEIELPIEEYADKISYYSVKEDYQEDCFAFDGKLYSGTLYKGKMTPTITSELFSHFTATSADTDAVRAEVNTFSSVRGSFTNFARYILGSTLPICVKDQSFENQMTAEYAKEQATKVSVSLANGTIQHCSLDITKDNYFYTCVPTGFPFSYVEENNLNDSSQNQLKYETGTKLNNDNFYSMFHHVIWFGYTGEYTENGCTVVFGDNGISSTEQMLNHLRNERYLTTRITNIQAGWTTALNYWTILNK